MKLLSLNFFKLFVTLYLICVTYSMSVRNLKEASLQIPAAPVLSEKTKQIMIANNISVSNNTQSNTTTNNTQTNNTQANNTQANITQNNNTQAFYTKTNNMKLTPSITSSNIPYYVPYFQNTSDNSTKFESVQIVKELSPAGKRELEIRENGDYEYYKILNSGYETPKFVNNIIDKYETPVTQSFRLENRWTPSNGNDADLWKNVEMNKFGNNIYQDRTPYIPARFEHDQFGNVIVHGPEDSRVRIIKSVPTIQNLGFLSIDQEDELISEDNF